MSFIQESKPLFNHYEIKGGYTESTRNWHSKGKQEFRVFDDGFFHVKEKNGNLHQTKYPPVLGVLESLIINNRLAKYGKERITK